MKILHTADWHLGRRLYGYELSDDHDAMLDEIIAIISTHRVDALIHAGDVFDSANPPHYAQRQYYSFLSRAVDAGCPTIIITGGNHDSPAVLNAPRCLLERMNVYVIGSALPAIEHEVVAIRSAQGNIVGYCCAVPFLRDRDLRFSLPGETEEERSRRIIEGIRQHYERCADAAQHRMHADGNQHVPLCTTGHLFAQGGIASDNEEKEQIHIGNLGRVGADTFPSTFSYVALGHLHRAQKVAGRDTIRYSGSPLPLDFSERNDTKEVIIAEWNDGLSPTITSIPLTTHRRLLRLSGTIEEIEHALRTYDAKAYRLQTLVEVRCSPESRGRKSIIDIHERMCEIAKDVHRGAVNVVHTAIDWKTDSSVSIDAMTTHDLQELEPLAVFERLMHRESLSDVTMQEIRAAFVELLSDMHEQYEDIQ
ncbi:MAG: exonuclease subunit SbcD [Bacteroidota bacterium]|nr:exonuclease subunit SbcD [Candidatus Kapabacteria bacterium]MDW8219020.1 exonuclease subunit SbcD [Bacteroidota bacterium]